MRVLIGAVILLALLPQPSQGQKASQTAADNKHDSQKQAIPSASQGNVSTTTTERKAANNDSFANRHGWDYYQAIAPPTWSNWFLVFVGIGAVIAAALTIRGIRAQSIITRESAEIQLRAYLGVTRVAGQIGSNFIRVQVHVKNAGQTPAYDVQQWIHQWVESYPLSVALPEPPDGFPMSRSTLGPGDHFILPAGWENLPCNMVVGTAQQTIYIYGKITYKDAFGRPRYTNYRLIYGATQTASQRPISSGGVTSVLFSPDVSGNEHN